MRTAFSLASAPPFVKNTFSKPSGATSAMRRASSPRTSFAIDGWIVARRPACSLDRRDEIRMLVPEVEVHQLRARSRGRRCPRSPRTSRPRPPRSGSGSMSACALHEWNTCARSSARTRASASGSGSGCRVPAGRRRVGSVRRRRSSPERCRSLEPARARRRLIDRRSVVLREAEVDPAVSRAGRASGVVIDLLAREEVEAVRRRTPCASPKSDFFQPPNEWYATGTGIGTLMPIMPTCTSFWNRRAAPPSLVKIAVPLPNWPELMSVDGLRRTTRRARPRAPVRRSPPW